MAYKNLNADVAGFIEQLKKYPAEVMTDIEKEADKIANKAKAKLKSTAPIDPDRKDGKHYRDSWKKRKTKKQSSLSIEADIKIISASKPHLTHLLENGHRVVLAEGKRFKKRDAKRFVKARVHIQPVQEEANAEVLMAVEKVLRRHGK